MATVSDQKSVKRKILNISGDVFGRKGYKATTVREICRAAGVNVAAINYHFGGKKELYRTVVEDLLSRTFAQYPVNEGVDPQSSPETRLRAFVRGALRRLLSPDGLSGYPGKGQLVAKEMADPSPFLDDLVEKFIRPTAAVLLSIIEEMLGPKATTKQIARCQISVIGQCFHYAMARPIITRLAVVDYQDASMIEELTDHITRFSLSGIDAMRQDTAGPVTHPAPNSENGGRS